MITGRENSALFPLISEPTFSPTLAHQMSRSETKGGVCCLSCRVLFRLIQSANRFSIYEKYTQFGAADECLPHQTVHIPFHWPAAAQELACTILRPIFHGSVEPHFI